MSISLNALKRCPSPGGTWPGARPRSSLSVRAYRSVGGKIEIPVVHLKPFTETCRMGRAGRGAACINYVRLRR